ncbi:MAG: SDR family oxidoreductase [Elusimicrobia bacterium]|nr:SDR family oxidoreductase [Elusimicrobiota bacterium]
MTDYSRGAVLITGAARRVGAAIARTLAQGGARHLLLQYRSSFNEARTLARELETLGARRVNLLKADLSRHAQVEKLAQTALKLEPGLEAVIFNAGVYERAPFGLVSEKNWDRHLDTNLKSTFFLAQRLGSAMKKKGRGHLILLSDWAGLRPYVNYLPYCLSKTGVLYLTHALAKALAPQVQVNAILPGPVLLPETMSPRGRLRVREATLLKRLGTPDDIARAVRFFLKDGAFSTGSWLTIDGGRLIA